MQKPYCQSELIANDKNKPNIYIGTQRWIKSQKEHLTYG